MKRQSRNLSRREFLERGLQGAGICALGGAALKSQAAGSDSKNPLAYDMDRFAPVDPKLIKYHSIGSFRVVDPEPRRIAVGPGNQLFIASRNGVQIVDPKGNLVGSVSMGSPARCVAVAEDGTIYTGQRTRVDVFSAKGQPLASWESPTRKTWLTGLTVGPNDVFAADSANKVVYRYDRSGKMLGRIGEKNKERSVPGLIVPSPYLDVKVGTDGLLRINNPGRHTVEVFTPAGDLEFSWGKPSAAIAGFCGCCNPVGLALLTDGRCITCEKGLPRVKVFSTDRELECVIAGPDLFLENGRAGLNSDSSDGTVGGLDAAVDSHGDVYILDLVASAVHVMSPNV
jgi:hypothetical protein